MAAISFLISRLSASFKAFFIGCATKLGCKVKNLFPLNQKIFTIFRIQNHFLSSNSNLPLSNRPDKLFRQDNHEENGSNGTSRNYGALNPSKSERVQKDRRSEDTKGLISANYTFVTFVYSVLLYLFSSYMNRICGLNRKLLFCDFCLFCSFVSLFIRL